MKKEKKNLIIYFSLAVVCLIIFYSLPLEYLLIFDILITFAGIMFFAFSIVTFIYSLKVVRTKDIGFGVVFLVLASILVILGVFILIGTLIGFFQGFLEGLSYE